MQAEGFEPDDFEDDAIEVWPENWPAWQLYTRICNQWRMSMAGPVALDYGVAFALLDRQHLSTDEWDQRFDDLQVLEAQALQTMADLADRKR